MQCLNPIDPGVYGPACSMRADKCIPREKPEGYISLPECVDFGNVDLSKGGVWSDQFLSKVHLAVCQY